MNNTDATRKCGQHLISFVMCMHYILHTELFLTKMMSNTDPTKYVANVQFQLLCAWITSIFYIQSCNIKHCYINHTCIKLWSIHWMLWYIIEWQFYFRVIFSFEITNGGYIRYIDRDTHPNNPETAPRIKVDLNGRTVSRTFTFHWDLMEPLQRCVRDHGLQCKKPPVFTPDVTTNVSQINSYQIQL